MPDIDMLRTRQHHVLAVLQLIPCRAHPPRVHNRAATAGVQFLLRGLKRPRCRTIQTKREEAFSRAEPILPFDGGGSNVPFERRAPCQSRIAAVLKPLTVTLGLTGGRELNRQAEVKEH